jgi:hypothetical protein
MRVTAIALGLVVIYLAYYSYALVNAESKYNKFQNSINSNPYVFVDVEVIDPADQWINEFKIGPDRRVNKRSFKECGYSQALIDLAYPGDVNGMIDIHKWQAPDFKYFDNKAVIKNTEIGIAKSLLCVNGDTIEICRKPRGELWVRSVLNGKQVVVWSIEEGQSYEYSICGK